jgi:hypothetical protein
MTFQRRTLHLSLVLALAGAALIACREEEQGRPLSFQKGVYTAQKGDQLPAATVQQMQDRAKKQQF